MNAQRKLWSLGGLGVLLALIIGVWFLTQPYTFHGSLIDPPAPAADFMLYDQDGAPFRLSEQRGNVVVLAFGYTSCPDVCPTTLADFKRIKQLLGNQADRVRFVFITVDPERDSPERLGKYMAAFEPTFRGLSGGDAMLDQVWQSYGVYHEKQFLDSAAGYLVDHTSRIYVVDGQGGLRLTFPYGMDTDSMLQDIRHLAKESL
jgi:protein SCO1/2